MDALHQLEIIWILFVQGLGDWLYAVLNTASILVLKTLHDLCALNLLVLRCCLGSGRVMLLLSNGVNAAAKTSLSFPAALLDETLG